MYRGYVKLHRCSVDNELYFSEKFTRWQAWQDLILNANFCPKTIFIRWHEINLEKWQIWRSEVTMAKRRRWSRDKVRRFLKRLETRQQIIQQKSHSTTVITISNYWKYNENDTTEKQQKNNRKTTDKTQHKNDKNIKNDKKEIQDKNVSLRKELEEYIKKWNSVKKIWVAKLWFPVARKITDWLYKDWCIKRKQFDYSEILFATNKYVKHIKSLKHDDKGYYTHRFSIREFISQRNWLEKHFNS